MNPGDVDLALAVEDALPVLLAFAGLVVLSRVFRKGDRGAGLPALVGAGLVGAAGLGKVSWKVNAALTGTDLAWLDDLLFWWLALGFALLATVAVSALRGRPLRLARSLASGVVVAAAAVFALVLTDAAGETADAVLLGLLVVATTVFGVTLVRLALRTGDRPAAWLFGINLAVTFVLAGLARIEDQTLALQWTEQLVNTASQAAFLVAAWRLHLTVLDQRPVWFRGAISPAAATSGSGG